MDVYIYTVMFMMRWSPSTFARRGGFPRHQIFTKVSLSSLAKSACMRDLTEWTKNRRMSLLNSLFLSYFTRFLWVHMDNFASPLSTRRVVESTKFNSNDCWKRTEFGSIWIVLQAMSDIIRSTQLHKRRTSLHAKKRWIRVSGSSQKGQRLWRMIWRL